MCFSAAASFTAAGGLSLIGAATLALRPAPRMMLLAAAPLIFAAHQAIEGFIWLGVDGGGVSQALIRTWIFIAEVFWPTYVPLAVLLLTPGRRRRQGLFTLLLTGLVVSGYFLLILVRNDFSAVAIHHHLVYAPAEPSAHRLPGLYLLATVAPLLIARERFVLAFGIAVLAGAIVTEIFFSLAGPSVWCFFAALASFFAFLAVREEKQGRRPRLSPTPGL
ncbi:MAG: hypothetical protein A3E78_05875 [Alphaproteobacteria bacterium RIFCSPHIGHO2_12_FULL_63_12]|nr:MAG: hypothetical protein A3E78_05875 [Alphaproteobacteria bacterium RIFCSPHIGHO2_12_FULL_63_12]